MLVNITAVQEEYSAWKKASVIMAILSSALALAWILGIRFFSEEFELAIVYVPTAVLIGGWLIMNRRRNRSHCGSNANAF